MVTSLLRPLIIAEIGVNYYEIAEQRRLLPREAAMLMAEEAGRAGADVVKFQTYKAEKLAAPDSPAYWDRSEEPSASQFQLFKKYDRLGHEEYKLIADHCDGVGVEFLTTPFDVDTVEAVGRLCSRMKVASADVTNEPLLEAVGALKKPVILSAGASELHEIQEAVRTLVASGAPSVTLLHCVLSYPTACDAANLWKIRALHAAFPHCAIGYSDHTKYSRELLITAWLLGACVIEKHFTLDKKLRGNDHYHAADPADLRELVSRIAEVSEWVGREGESWVANEERRAREFARRGMYVVRDVPRGTVVAYPDVIPLRPQASGLSPVQFAKLRKPVALRDLRAGSLLNAEDLAELAE